MEIRGSNLRWAWSQRILRLMKTANLPNSEIEKIRKQVLKEKKRFYKEIFSSDSAVLSITIKSHLVVENLVDRILKFSSPHPKYVVDRMGFAQKNEILKFSSLIDERTYEKIKALNNIRNKFAHNIKYKPNFSEIKLLTEGKIKNRDKHKMLVSSIQYLIGLLTFLENISAHHPLLLILLNKSDILKKDRLYKYVEKHLKEGIKTIHFKGWEI